MNEKLRKLIDCLEKKASQRCYIYRGESRYYDKISSGLYREYSEDDITDFNVRERQKLKDYYDFDDLEKAEKPINLNSLGHGGLKRIVDHSVQKEFFLYKEQEFGKIDKILNDKELYDLYVALLQHHGWTATNLIDFSENLDIALFFSASINPMMVREGSYFDPRKAVVAHPDFDGRIIFFDVHDKYVKKISWDLGINNAKDQQSIFVCHPKGIIDDEVEEGNIISIPKELKKPLLEYLQKQKGISLETVYKDWTEEMKYFEKMGENIRKKITQPLTDLLVKHQKTINEIKKRIHTSQLT